MANIDIQNTSSNIDTKGISWVERIFSHPERTIRLVWGIERSVFSVIGENSRNALKIKWFNCA